MSRTSGCTLSHNRNHDSTGGNTFDHSHVNSDDLRKAGRGGDWARLSSKPGSPTTLSKILSRCAATVSCGQYNALRPDSLRIARQSVVGTERSVGICSILLNDCVHDHRLAQVARASVRIEVKTT